MINQWIYFFFNPTTTIRYQLPAISEVKLTIYNLLGQQVREVVNQSQGPGSYQVLWDGRCDAGVRVASGMYFYRLTAGAMSIPNHFELNQNYPNPFNLSTTIEFYLPKSGFVTLKIYNTLGEEVTTLVLERLTAGKHKYDWDASGLASGVYLYRLSAGSFKETQKLILLR